MSQKKLPIFALIGRPNVGKSSLFNRILNQKSAIVDNIAGTTRDRIWGTVEHQDIPFTLIDTAGIYGDNDSFLKEQMTQQTETALQEADGILFVVDGKTGLHPIEKQIAHDLRLHQKRCYVIVNKIDNKNNAEANSVEFFSLGFDHVVPVSAKNNVGIDEMISSMLSHLNCRKSVLIEDPIKVAFLGRPNVGKSSLLNALVRDDRLIVSDTPGTTRDSIDLHIQRHKEHFIFIDTAGMRYRRKIDTKLETHSVGKTIETLKRCNIVCILINASEGLTTQDLKILRLANKEKKPSILIINKWDLFPNFHQRDFIREELPKLKPFSYLNYLFVSAKTEKNIFQIFDLVKEVNTESTKRISTGILNRFIENVLISNPPTYIRNKRLKIYYVSQVSTPPPTFLFSINSKTLLTTTYKRYLQNQLYTHFGFCGLPITLKFKDKSEQIR